MIKSSVLSNKIKTKAVGVKRVSSLLRDFKKKAGKKIFQSGKKMAREVSSRGLSGYS